MRLLLESALALDGEFGSHLVGLAWPKMSSVEGNGLVFRRSKFQPRDEYCVGPGFSIGPKNPVCTGGLSSHICSGVPDALATLCKVGPIFILYFYGETRPIRCSKACKQVPRCPPRNAPLSRTFAT